MPRVSCGLVDRRHTPPVCLPPMSETYRLTVAVRKRNDLDTPRDIDEAVEIVRRLLNEGSFVEVVSVLPERKSGGEVRWG